MSDSSPMTGPAVLAEARRLRQSGDLDAGLALVRDAVSRHLLPRVQEWQHRPLFWQDLATPNGSLTRRRGSDAAFIRELWAKPGFLHSFHRIAPPLPAEQAALQALLDREYLALLTDSRALHWIVRDGQGRPWGVLSLTDISLHHERAEVLLGLAPGAPFGLATLSMLILFRFFFGSMGFHKLYSLVFPDNPHSHKGTLHLGFVAEGLQRGQVREPHARIWHDLQQYGLLRTEAFAPANQRLWARLSGLNVTLSPQ